MAKSRRSARATGGDRAPAIPARPGQRQRDRPQLTLWGRHAVTAAIVNPDRAIRALYCSDAAAAALNGVLVDLPAERGQMLPTPVLLSRPDFEQFVPPAAVHQGYVALVEPLATPALDSLLDGNDRLFLVLDQVTDPQNVGAVLRSAAAFSATAVIVQIRHAPPADGALAKAASGALERVPLIGVTNIARCLQQLAHGGVHCIGLVDAVGAAGRTLEQAHFDGATALVLGAEGRGLRRLTAEYCDELVRLPTNPDFGTLNISNAAAVALYEVQRHR